MKYLQVEQRVRFEQVPNCDSDSNLVSLLDNLFPFLLLVSMEKDLQLSELNLQKDGDMLGQGQEQGQGQGHSYFGRDY